MYTASSAFLDALQEHGVSVIFANFGSDHPALIEAIAAARAEGRPIPAVVTCPNEMVGMSAAQGYWQASGRPQAVVVHVECGTQALAGAVHNAAKGRAPVLIFAGASPFTQDGELKGSRNEFIQWIQDVHDQRGIVRGYMRYDAELRTGRNVPSMVHRAMQFALSEPQGPVYLMGAREVMEEEVEPQRAQAASWRRIAPAALAADAVATIGEALAGARRPLVVTSYAGRNPAAVGRLQALCRRLGIGVLESVPTWMNYPHDDPMYLGNQWNEVAQSPVLAEADVVLVLDSDVPWIPRVSRPPDAARIFHVDADPLKQEMPLWHIPAEGVHRADCATALAQLSDWFDAHPADEAAAAGRRTHYAALHDRRARDLAAAGAGSSGPVTVAQVAASLRRQAGPEALYLNESITNYRIVTDHLAPTRPGSLFFSGGGALGWNGGAAIGVKLAHPDATVVSICGDGTFMFTVPSSVHWMARRYGTPFLQVVLNNRGWKSPKRAALAVHPDGFASRANDVDTSFEPSSDYGGIAAAAGGAWSATVREAAEVEGVIGEALRVVREDRRCAVVEVWLDHH